jgi:3-dehydroquinate synthase
VETIQVEHSGGSYPILIGGNLLKDKALIDRHVPAGDVMVVSNTIVAPLYGAAVAEALSARRLVDVRLPDGEAHKTLATVARILDVLAANAFGRDCTIIALGGGVVGDMAGFAAACYQRGVACVQIPTTLLAQADASVGGKTGVNHPAGKNLIGAFHQPTAVITDLAALASLPERELRAGLAEVLKCALICDADFFVWLEANIEALMAKRPEALTHAIRRCCEIKATIVRRDERESGDRALLNFGHTFGHAIEAATSYDSWLHGEAVAAGIMMAATMSNEAGLLAAADLARVRALLERAALPLTARGVSGADALAHMRVDKKVKGGRVRFVLLRRIGEAFVTADYPDGALKRTLDLHLS